MSYELSAEMTLVGALLTTDVSLGAVDQAALLVSPDEFQDSRAANLYRAILALRTKNLLPDAPGCIAELENLKIKTEDASLLFSQALDSVPLPGQVQRYAKVIREKIEAKRISRTIQVAGARLAEGESISWLKSELMAELGQIEAEQKTSEDSVVADAHAKVVGAIRDRINGDTSSSGLRLGLPALDQLTTGINREELWVVGGMPGRGKTALALQSAMNLAGDGFPVYFISLEMSRYAVMRRLLKMKFGTAAVEYPNSKQLSALFEYEKELRQLPFYLNDSSSLEIEELISRARMRIARSGIRLVIVDYIQLIRFEGKDRRERVSECTDRLRRLAKDTGVPVMALSQLRRSQNVNDRPTMIDLKESGDIEAHAHVILLLYMPVGQDGAFTGEDELIVGKQREGPTGKVPIAFLGTKCQFYERETHV